MITRPQTIQKSKAYTLLEVLIAMALFAILATSLQVATLSNYQLSYAINYQNIAHDVAHGYAGQLRNRPYSALSDFANGNSSITLLHIRTDGDTSKLESFVISNGGTFEETVLVGNPSSDDESQTTPMEMEMTLNVSDVSASSSSGIKAVEITLGYSYSYTTSRGTKTLTDTITLVKAE